MNLYAIILIETRSEY